MVFIRSQNHSFRHTGLYFLVEDTGFEPMYLTCKASAKPAQLIPHFFNVPEVGVEPTRAAAQLILSQSCLPFQHSGILLYQYFKEQIKDTNKFPIILIYFLVLFTIYIFTFLSFVCLSDGLISMSILFFQR